MISPWRLSEALVQARIPVVSVAIVDHNNPNTTFRIEFSPQATATEVQIGTEIATNFDWSEAAELAYKEQTIFSTDVGALIRASVLFALKHVQRTVPGIQIPSNQEILDGTIAELRN